MPDRETHEPPLDVTYPSGLLGVEIPDRKWVIPEWMPWGAVTAIYGDGGTGKSLLAQQLMTSCATDRSWLGLPVAPVKALGIFCEDDETELRRRQRDINAALGVDWPDLENLAWVSRYGYDNLLMTFDGGHGRLTPFWSQVHDTARDFGAELVILDTAADCYGGDENRRPEVRQFVQAACGALARATAGSVLLCAHPSAAGLTSGRGDGGSTAWNNAVRSRWFLHRPERDEEDQTEPDDNRRILERKKANYAGAGSKLDLVWRAGTFEPLYGSTTVAAIVAHNAEAAFLGMLDQAERTNRPVSASARAGNYAPRLFKQMGANGFRTNDLERAMHNLIGDGSIILVPYGRKGDQRTKIVRSPNTLHASEELPL